MNLQSKRWVAVTVILSESLLLSVASAGQTKPLEQAKLQTANQQRIGQVTIEWGRMQSVWKKNVGFTLDLFNGSTGKNAQIKSKHYDMAAPHISLDVRKGAVYTGTATGGVRVEVRQDLMVDNKPTRRITTLEGDNATYYAAVPPPEKGTPGKPAQIVVRGNVRWVTRSPEFSPTDPLNITAESVVVKFIGDTITIDADNGKGSATPLEREPKEKP